MREIGSSIDDRLKAEYYTPTFTSREDNFDQQLLYQLLNKEKQKYRFSSRWWSSSINIFCFYRCIKLIRLSLFLRILDQIRFWDPLLMGALCPSLGVEAAQYDDEIFSLFSLTSKWLIFNNMDGDDQQKYQREYRLLPAAFVSRKLIFWKINWNTFLFFKFRHRL